MKKLVNLVWMLCCCCLCGYAQGLAFSTYESDSVQKTSYSVFEKQLVLQDDFSISFDLALHDYASQGYVLRLKDRKQPGAPTYSFVYYYDNSQWSYLKFNVETQECKAVDTLYNHTLGARCWIPVKMEFSLCRDSLLLSVGGRHYRMGGLGLPKQMTPSLLFGSSKFSEEIPPFSIRDLVVEVGDIRRMEFPLNETEGNAVHDRNGKVWGKAIRPVWLLNDSYYWKLMHTQRSETLAGYDYASEKGNFFFFNWDSLYTLDVRHHRWSGRPHSPVPMDVNVGTCFYDPSRQMLHLYEIACWTDGCNVCGLDVQTGETTPESNAYFPFQCHHHSTCLDAQHDKFYLFGGFGLRKYASELVEYDVQRQAWTTVALQGDTIFPRFFSSMGALNEDEILLFGGTGNKSGDQSLGKQYYYDLFLINLKTHIVKKYRDYSWQGINMVPVRHLVVSEDRKSFYTLCYPVQKAYSYLQLYRFSLEEDSYEALGDTIPMESQNILSNANLYYNAELKELYCCVEECDKQGGDASLTRFYALSFPAVSESALSIYDLSGNGLWGKAAAGLLLLMAGAVVFLFLRVRRKGSSISAVGEEAMDVSGDEPTLSSQCATERHRATSNALYLFGEFTALNRRGVDISYLFTGKIRQLFLLMLLNSVGQGEKQGITSTYIYGLLWPEKEPGSAKNLKGVTINRLRKILEDLDGVELVYANSHYSIRLTDDCYCDYQEYNEQICLLRQGESLNGALQRPLLDILQRGRFLKSVEDSLFDDYKSEQENHLHGLLTIELEHRYAKDEYEWVVRLAGLLLQIDSLSDVALWYMLNAYHRMKKEDQAMTVYYSYIAEYAKSVGQSYAHSYSDMIQTDLRDSFR